MSAANVASAGIVNRHLCATIDLDRISVQFSLINISSVLYSFDYAVEQVGLLTLLMLLLNRQKGKVDWDQNFQGMTYGGTYN